MDSAKSSKNILILGGAGFLGANLARRCLKEPGVNITLVDSLDPAFKSNKENISGILDRVKFIQGDIRDDELLKGVIPGKNIIFNCAAQTSHPLSLANPIFDAEINCIGHLKVLQTIRDFNPGAIVIFPSTSTLVGKAINDVIDENHPERPLDIYSANKGVGEKYYYIFHKVFGVKSVILRFANLFGPFGKTDPAFGFLNYFIGLTVQGKPLTIYGDGAQTRNVMFVDDATDIMWLAANDEKLIGEPYFAAHYEHYSVREIAETIAEIFRGKTEFIPWPDLRKRIDVDKVKISSERLYSLTGWKPKYSLKEGLEITKQRMKS